MRASGPRWAAAASSFAPNPRQRARASHSASTAPERVAVIGSGNWGTTVAKMIGENVRRRPDLFDQRVAMWVHEETHTGRRLSDLINEVGGRVPKNDA